MEFKKRIIVSSFGIHTGGGLNLLYDILNNDNYIKTLLADYRLIKKKKFEKIKKIYIKKNYIYRFIIFIREIMNCEKNDLLLCFNNIPPLIRPKCKSILFLQNAFYVSNISFDLTLFQILKIFILRTIFNLCLKNVDEIYVQNSFLKKKILEKLKIKKFQKKIKVYKIVLLPEIIKKKIERRKRKILLSKKIKKNFFYPASYDSHKNHLNLIKSFKNISHEKIKLYITLSKKDFSFFKKSLNLNNQDLKKIINLGVLPNYKLKKYYESCNLIFPSYLESFGLPLYEGYAYGSPIIASNKKFVTDNFKNIIKFNPDNYHSIIKAVKLSMFRKVNNDLLKVDKKLIFSGKNFLKKIISNHAIS